MTNYDYIKQMDIEEFSKFLVSGIFSPCNQCVYNIFRDGNFLCDAPDTFRCTKGYASALVHSWLVEINCITDSSLE